MTSYRRCPQKSVTSFRHSYYRPTSNARSNGRRHIPTLLWSHHSRLSRVSGVASVVAGAEAEGDSGVAAGAAGGEEEGNAVISASNLPRRATASEEIPAFLSTSKIPTAPLATPRDPVVAPAVAAAAAAAVAVRATVATTRTMAQAVTGLLVAAQKAHQR